MDILYETVEPKCLVSMQLLLRTLEEDEAGTYRERIKNLFFPVPEKMIDEVTRPKKTVAYKRVVVDEAGVPMITCVTMVWNTVNGERSDYEMETQWMWGHKKYL